MKKCEFANFQYSERCSSRKGAHISAFRPLPAVLVSLRLSLLLVTLPFLVSLFLPCAYAQEATVAEKVVNRALAKQPVSERDLLLLMSQPKEFQNYQKVLKAAAPELEQKLLGIRREIFLRALDGVTTKEGGGLIQAVIALGSWAEELNPGDMDIIVAGGRDAAKQFNEALHKEIERIFKQKGDDVCEEVFSKGARFTVETFEIYVSTIEDFGYSTLERAYHDAMAIAAKEGEAAGAAYLASTADAILEKNLAAQRFAAVQKEYYPGASGQDFVRDYFRKEGKSRTWRVGDNGRIDSTWEQGLPANKLRSAMISDLGLSVKDMSGAFKFPVIADELVQWGERAKLGAREQAKGLVRAYQAKPPGIYGNLTPEEGKLLEIATEVAGTARENQAYIRLALRGMSEQQFSEAGEAFLWKMTKASNNEAINILIENQWKAISGQPVDAQYRRIKDYMLSNEQLAGYSKLKPEHLKLLAKDLADQAEKLSESARKASFLDEFSALLEYMADGTVKGEGELVEMTKRLAKLAFQQKRLSPEAAEDAIKAVRGGKELAPETEQILAVLRRDLADLASIRALSPESETLADCIRTSSLFSKGGLTLTEELQSLVTDIGKLSNIELLQLGFKNSEITMLREINAASAQGMRLSAIGAALQKTAPKNWRILLKASIEDGRKAVPGYVAIGGGFALWQIYRIATDPGIPDEEQTRHIGDVIYQTFPTVGLALDGLPLALLTYAEGGSVDKAGLAQGIALAGLEMVGLANPALGLTLLAVYMGTTVTVGVFQAERDRSFVQALYEAFDNNSLKVKGGGTKSFNVMGLQVTTDPSTKQVLVIHSPAFKDLYTKDGDVILDTGEANKPYDHKVNEALRDFAKRYAWANNNDLKVWEAAVRAYFPDSSFDLDQVEMWNLGDVSAQAANVTGKQFLVGARLVRRYLNQRDLLVEATLRQLRARIDDMSATVSSVGQWEKELTELEKILTMDGKIVPNAKAEQSSYLGWAMDAATSSVTRTEQVGAIWKRYLKTYKEAVSSYAQITKRFESAELPPPDAGLLYGLVGKEATDQPKIDLVNRSFLTTYNKAYQEYSTAKGGIADLKDPFDADAWKRLLNLRLTIFLSEGLKTTQARLARLEQEVKEVLDEVREHYKMAFEVSINGQAEVEAERDTTLEAVAKSGTKAGQDYVNRSYIEWFVNDKYYNRGNTLWFTPIQEGTYRIRAYAVVEAQGKRQSLAYKDHTLKVVRPAKPDEKTQDDGKKRTNAGDTFTQAGVTPDDTASAGIKTGDGKQQDKQPDKKPDNQPRSITQLTDQEKRGLLNCICRCGSGIVGAGYGPEPGGDSPSCADLANGPCIGGDWGCYRWHMPSGGECVSSCYKSSNVIGDSNATNTILSENRKNMKPLKVKFNYEKCPIHAQMGDVITFNATTEGGIGTKTVNWSGEGSAKENSFTFINTRQPGSYAISASVSDSDGHSATVSCAVIVDVIRVKIEKTSPSSDSLPIGSSASFKATIKSGANDASGDFLFRWQPHPEVQFGTDKSPQFETTSGTTTATFTKMGTFPISVNVLKKVGGAYQTVGESNQIRMTIAEPKLRLTADKNSPKVGDKVVITVQEEPKMSDNAISFWWEIKGEAVSPGPEPNIPNSRAYSFKPKDSKPVTVTVHGKAKDGGNDLGSESITITPQTYTVSVSEPRYLESPPQVWRCDTQLGQAQHCGMVTLKPNEFVVFRDIFLSVTATPKPESPRYKWTVDPSGSCGLPGAGSELKLNCSNTGTYTAKVEITNADGAKLGDASQSVTISVSQNDLNNSKNGKDAYDKLQKAKEAVAQGKLDEGIPAAEEASKLDPKNTEASGLVAKWKKDRDEIKLHITKMDQLLKDNKIADAAKEFQPAQGVHPKYQPVVDAGKRLQLKQQEASQKQGQAQKLKAEGNALEAQGKLQEAINKYKESIGITPDTSLEAHIKQLEAKLQEDARKKATADTLWQDGMTLFNQKRVNEALVKFRESVKVTPNPQRADYIKKLETEQSTAQKLNDEGAALQKQGKLTEAVAKYKESIKHWPNPDLDKQIAALEDEAKKKTDTQPKQDTQKKDQADKLWKEGMTLSNQGRPGDALPKLKESLTYWQDATRTKYVQDLEGKRSKAQALRDEGAKLQQQNKIKEATVKYRESLIYIPDKQLEEHVHKLEASLAAATATSQQSTQPVTPPTASAGAWTGTWKSDKRPGKEDVVLVLTQNSNRVTGTYTVDVMSPTATGAQQKASMSGKLEGTTSGSKVNGFFRDRQDKENTATFELTMAPDGNSFTAMARSDGTTENWTARRVGTGQATVTPVQPSQSLDGTYSGSIFGVTSGTIQFSVTGEKASGTISGTYQGDRFNGSWTGTVDKTTGAMLATLKGDLSGNAFTGNLAGRIQGTQASGTWAAKNQYGNPMGSWEAKKGSTTGK